MAIEINKIISGNRFQICELVKNGKSHVQTFITGLDNDESAFIIQSLEHIAQNGPPQNIQKFRNEGNGIYAIKRKQVRLYCFFHIGKLIILTNGTIKKDKKAKPSVLKRALKLKNEYLKEIEGEK